MIAILYLSMGTIVCAQLRFEKNSSTNYMSVNTYSGAVNNDGYVFKFAYSGTQLNVPNWKITVRPAGPAYSQDRTKIFPSDKIGFRIRQTAGTSNAAIPSASEIGIPPLVMLLPGQETFLVPNAQRPLSFNSTYNGYYELRLQYDFLIQGGSYLADYQNDRDPYTQMRYDIPMQFTAYGTNNEIIASFTHTYQLDVFRLTGVPPLENQFSLQVGGAAQNGLLEFRNATDYANGQDVVYPNALSVSSNVGYQLTVRSVQPAFSSIGGGTLPLDIARVQLIPAANTQASPRTVTLQSNAQTVATGSSTQLQQRFFDIRYFTVNGDRRLMEAAPQLYSTTLQYQITPL